MKSKNPVNPRDSNVNDELNRFKKDVVHDTDIIRKVPKRNLAKMI
jgi:hypothetical protein